MSSSALKAQGITYAELARRVGLSESSIKRMLAKHTLSLHRLEQICNAAGLEISDLVDLLDARREYLTELTPEQEEALLADPKLLLTTYLLINGWRAGLAQMQLSMERLAREFDELARRDAVLPLSERHACGAVLAIRPWEFSVFKGLRRTPR